MRDVAALCAMIITKQEAATGSSARVSLQVTSGSPIEGSPPGTGPTTAMPRSAKWNAALATIVPIMGPVEDRDFASSWRMRMHPPEKIMGKLQRRRLLKTDHRRALRIKRAEYVVYGAVLAAGVQRLQYHQDRVLLLGMQKSLLVGEFLAEVFGLLPRRFRRFVVALVAWIELVQTQLFTGIDVELFAVVHAFPLRACRPNAASFPASRGTRQELI